MSKISGMNSERARIRTRIKTMTKVEIRIITRRRDRKK